MQQKCRFALVLLVTASFLVGEALARPGGSRTRGRSAPGVQRGPQRAAPTMRGPQRSPVARPGADLPGHGQAPRVDRPTGPAANNLPGNRTNRPAPTRNELNHFLNRSGSPGPPAAGQSSNSRPREQHRQQSRAQTRSPAELQQQWQNVRNDLQQRWQNAPEPFTPAWYAEHPNAWHATHPHADAWAVASWAAVAGWVGAAAEPVVYNYTGYTTTTPTVYEDAQAVYAEDAEEAAALAETGSQAEEPAEADWLPLGVFALVPPETGPSNAMLQLTVSKDGLIRGTYYDMLTNTSHDVHGSVDTQTQRAAWRIGASESVVFETGLGNLTIDEAPLVVRFGANEPQRWQMVRMQPQQ